MAVRALRVLVTPPSGHRAIVDRAAADLGFDVALEVLPTEELFRKAVDEPDSFDIVQAEFWMLDELRRQACIAPIPTGMIGRFAQISKLFTEGTVDGREVTLNGVAPHTRQFADDRGWLNAVPTICNSDTLGWRPDRMETPVESWGDLLRTDLAGRVALADVPAVSHIEVSLACQALGRVHYADIGQQTVAEIDATYAILGPLAQDGHFNGLWASFEHSVENMAEGPVALQSLWPPAVTALRQRSVPIRYAPLREGARGWAGGLCLSSQLGPELRAPAIAYMNWYIDGWAGAFLTRQGYYSSTPDAARRFLTASEWDYWQCGLPASAPIVAPSGAEIGRIGDVREGGSFSERMSQIACWSVRMLEHAHLRARWTSFRQQVAPGPIIA